MKAFCSILFASVLIIAGLNAQDLKFEVQQGYPITSDIKSCPQFRGDVYVSGGKKITNLEMVIEYTAPNTDQLAFEFYASGTRDYNGAEAKDIWYTNNPPEFYERSASKHRARVHFYLANGQAPVTTINRFKMMELYFRFLRGGVYKTGDVIVITIKNIKVTFEDGSIGNLSDTELRIKLTDYSGVEEAAESANLISFYPNPASEQLSLRFNDGENAAIEVQLVDLMGVVQRQQGLGADQSGSGLTLDIHGLPSGRYFCRILKGGRTFCLPVIISR